MAKRQLEITNSGQIWSSQPGQTGLGGLGIEVSLGDLKLEDDTAQEATLTLTLKAQNPLVSFGLGRIYARVKFGVGTASQTVLLDWSQGTSIVLPCGVCNVAAVQVDSKGAPALPMPIPGEGAPVYVPNPNDTIDVPVILTACLAAGPRSSVRSPTLTQTVDLPENSGPGWWVPQRAKGVIVGDPRGIAATDLLVNVTGCGSTNRFSLANAADSSIRTTGILLPGNSEFVTTFSAGGVTGVPICWLLDG